MLVSNKGWHLTFSSSSSMDWLFCMYATCRGMSIFLNAMAHLNRKRTGIQGIARIGMHTAMARSIRREYHEGNARKQRHQHHDCALLGTFATMESERSNEGSCL